MNMIGKTTIHPLLFYTGKICGYLTWVLFLLSLFKIIFSNSQSHDVFKITSYSLLTTGLIFIIINLVNLGRSTRLGLPSEKTEFKSSGIYKFSRNPMYLGFNLLTIASIVYLGNIYIMIMGVYSIIIYHFIIIGEEKFLEHRFGKAYIKYKQKVRRYL